MCTRGWVRVCVYTFPRARPTRVPDACASYVGPPGATFERNWRRRRHASPRRQPFRETCGRRRPALCTSSLLFSFSPPRRRPRARARALPRPRKIATNRLHFDPVAKRPLSNARHSFAVRDSFQQSYQGWGGKKLFTFLIASDIFLPNNLIFFTICSRLVVKE